MKAKRLLPIFFHPVLLIVLLLFPANFRANPEPQSAPNITVTGQLSADRIPRGRSVRGTVVMDIPSGYHVNSNKPLEKFLVPTELKIQAPEGIHVSAVVYPRPVLRSFKFSKNKVSVYEGRATMRFNVAIPAKNPIGSIEFKARLRYQSCNDEVCFPPLTREINLWLAVE